MGGSNGKEIYSGSIVKAYSDEVLSPAGIVEGGAEPAVRTLLDLKGYGASALSASKVKLIRDIAREMKKTFKVEGTGAARVAIDPEADIDTLISQLNKAIPSPSTNGRSWSSKLGKQTATCRQLARIINNRFGYSKGTGIINVDGTAEEICEQVSEIMRSLFTGMHTEFLMVRNDAERLLRNIKVLDTALKRNFDAINSKLAAAGASDANEDVAGATKILRDTHAMIMAERERQELMLGNMLNIVVEPHEVDMAKILKSSRDYKGLVRGIKAIPGTRKFGEKVAYALSGIGSVAAMANSVNKALKELDISVGEWAKEQDLGDLKQTVYSKIQGKLDAPVDKLDKYFKAANVLFRYHYNNDDIVNELKGKRGADEDCTQGGDVEPVAKVGGLKVSKKIEKRSKIRRQMLIAFNQQISARLDNFHRLVESLAQQIGTDRVPTSDDMHEFVRALELIPPIHERNTYYALSGYYRDIMAKEERESFVSAVKNLLSKIDRLLKNSQYSGLSQFKSMKADWESVLRTIEDFSAKFDQDFGVLRPDLGHTAVKGADDDEVPSSGSGFFSKVKTGLKKVAKATGLSDAAADVASSAQENAQTLSAHGAEVAKRAMAEQTARITDGGDDTGISVSGLKKLAYDLEDSKSTMKFFFRVASIRENLKKSSVELKDFGSDYEKVLGDAVAAARDKIRVAQNAAVEALKNPVAGGAADSLSALKAATDAPGNIYGKNYDTLIKPAIDFQNSLHETKDRMMRIAESVDLYLKHFTDAIVARPDEVKQIQSMLESTEVISKWFTATAGNLICQAFETFPGSFNGHTAKYSNIAQTWKEATSKYKSCHYYWRVQANCRLGVSVADASANFTDQLGKMFGTTTVENKANLYRDAAADWAGWYTAHGSPGGDEIVAGQAVSLPGIPFLGVPIHEDYTGRTGAAADDANAKEHTGLKVLEYLRKAMDNVTVLKNIIACFVTIGDKFGGESLYKKTNMSPVQIYKGLIDYIVNGSVAAGHFLKPRATESIGHLNGTVAATVVSGDSTTIKANGTVKLGPGGDGVDFADTAGYADNAVRSNLYMYMRHAGNAAGARTVKALMTDSTDGPNADWIFQLVIKAIVSKIMTVVGVYNMLHRPVDAQGLGYYSDTRLILGGGPNDPPKVIPEALELYIRLPLLAEFWREIFDFDNEGALNPGLDAASYRRDDRLNRPTIISMLPEMDGTFSGLIALIFDRARHVQHGTYSETDMRALIAEINKIYLSFKGSKNVVSDVVAAFISEINQRYGVILRKEREKYLQERTDRYKERYTTEEMANADFEILPDEEDNARRPGPSDSYLTEGATALGAPRAHKWAIDAREQEYISSLRNKIAFEFGRIWEASKSRHEYQGGEKGLAHLMGVSFQNIIRARKEEMRYARSEKEAFRIVSQAVNGFGEFSMNSLEQSLILFHETVVLGLNSLHATYLLVEEFRKRMLFMAGTIRELRDAIDAEVSGGAGALSDVVARVAAMHEKVDPALLNTDRADVIVPLGRDGATANVNVGMLFDAVDVAARADPENFKRSGELLNRFGVKSGRVFQRFFETLWTHGTNLNKLVDMRFDVVDHPDCDKKGFKDLEDRPKTLLIHLDHSKLREVVDRQFLFLHKMFDKFRGLIPKSILDKYERLQNENMEDNVGSLYWLEREFMQKTILGKFQGYERSTLDDSNEWCREIVNHLAKPWEFNARGLETAGYLIANHWGTVNGKYDQMNVRTLAVMMVDDGKVPYDGDEPAAGERASASHHALINFDVGGLTKLLFQRGNAGATVPLVQGLGTHYNTFYDPAVPNIDIAGDRCRTLVISFNKLLASYLHNFYDSSSEKIYLGVIDKFANGAFSSSVMNGERTINDTNNGVGATALPDAELPNVLFRTIAAMMRQLLIDTMPRKTEKHYLETDLAEIPMFIKEKFRNNMPMFKKLFTVLESKCMFVKAVLSAFPCGPDENPRNSQDRYNITINRIIEGCRAISSCIDTVMGEIADSPVYLEINQGSIKDYEIATGTKPFMPLSSLATFMRETGPGQHLAGRWKATGLPFYSMGDDYFRLQYGARGLLSAEVVGVSSVPGMKNIVQKHNETTDTEYHVSEKDLDSFVSDTVTLIRFVSDTKNIKSVFCGFRQIAPRAGVRVARGLLDNGDWLWSQAAIPLVHAEGGGDNGNLIPDKLRVLALMNTPAVVRDGRTAEEIRASTEAAVRTNDTVVAKIVSLTSSRDQVKSRGEVVKVIEAADTTIVRGSRPAIRVMNIIDMNVVPLNLNALMREVPLVNLYNYAHTFDVMIADILDVDNRLVDADTLKDALTDTAANGIRKGTSGTDLYDPNEQALKTLAWLTMNPYGDVSSQQYHELFARIMRGALGVEGLGRPKFTADDFFNKALFGEVYYAGVQDEAGPAAANVSESTILARIDNVTRGLNDRAHAGGRVVGNYDEFTVPEAATTARLLYKAALDRPNGGANAGDKYISELASLIVNYKCATVNPAHGYTKDVIGSDIASVVNDTIAPLFRVSTSAENKSHELHYLHSTEDGKSEVVTVNVGSFKALLSNIGYMRFNTVFSRNMVWLTNIQRILRLRLRRDMQWYNRKVVSDMAIAAPGITEFFGNDSERRAADYKY